MAPKTRAAAKTAATKANNEDSIPELKGVKDIERHRNRVSFIHRFQRQLEKSSRAEAQPRKTDPKSSQQRSQADPRIAGRQASGDSGTSRRGGPKGERGSVRLGTGPDPKRGNRAY